MDAYGPGPFEVVRVVDHNDRELPAGLILRTQVGEQEVSEIWLTLVDESDKDTKVISSLPRQEGDEARAALHRRIGSPRAADHPLPTRRSLFFNPHGRLLGWSLVSSGYGWHALPLGEETGP